MSPQLGSTAIGIRTKEGVVLAVEKRITSPLLVRQVVYKGISASILNHIDYPTRRVYRVYAGRHPLR